ncbi:MULTISPECIES: hypothetical protein [Yersinia]|uniref:hypothetical protein n=1 Tax=Yersinia TaxID=629 RepID=UPI0005E20EB4|nr:hypothetical protein [Yersinia kristensenii]CNE40283.1 Uncharacterised protein [Yersinia kristensenii]
MRKSNSITTNDRSVPSAAFNLVVIVLLVAITWLVSSKYIAPYMLTIPWSALTILLVPLGSCVALLHELSKVQKNVTEDITKTEARRLKHIVRTKQRTSLFTLIFQVIIIAINIILSLASPSDVVQLHKEFLINFSTSMMIVSLYLIIPSVLGIKEINDFETKVKRRKVDNKNLKSAISRLQ